MSDPVSRRVIAVCGGDGFATGALHAARSLAGPGFEPPVILDGTTSPTVVGRQADGCEVAVVILPVPYPRSSERRRYADRACRMVAATRHPVLIVPEMAPWPPRRCVIAMDFSRAAITAGATALDFLACPGEAAHVFVDDSALGRPNRDGEPMPRHISLLFDALPATLRQRPGLLITRHWVRGTRVSGLMDFAAVGRADLLSVGQQGHPPSAETPDEPFGPTVRSLIEAAPCSLVLSGAI